MGDNIHLRMMMLLLLTMLTRYCEGCQILSQTGEDALSCSTPRSLARFLMHTFIEIDKKTYSLRLHTGFKIGVRHVLLEWHNFAFILCFTLTAIPEVTKFNFTEIPDMVPIFRVSFEISALLVHTLILLLAGKLIFICAQKVGHGMYGFKLCAENPVCNLNYGSFLVLFGYFEKQCSF